MTTISKPAELEQLIQRLRELRPDTPRKWGTMTAGEMLCHLGDATASVRKRGAEESADASREQARSHPVLKWIALRSPLPWPQGLKTPAAVDPHAGGTKPGDFEADRQRAIEGLRSFAQAPGADLPENHGAFGRLTREEWNRWAYRHTDHHLRQFGL